MNGGAGAGSQGGAGVTATGRRVTVSPVVVFAELDGEAVLLDTESGIYFGLDPVGTRIWELLASGAGEAQVLATLHQEYEVAPDRLAADVAAFVDSLTAKGLVSREG
jgi:hypothetical protein